VHAAVSSLAKIAAPRYLRPMTRTLVPALLLALASGPVASCKKDSASTPAPATTPPPAGSATPAVPTPKPAPVPAVPLGGDGGAAAIDPASTPSGKLVGTAAPDFSLPDLSGAQVSLASFKGKTVVLEWFNPECPFVKKAHGKGSLVDAAARHTAGGVVWLAINSGAPGKQGNALEVNQAAAKEWKLAHPILRDEDGKVGKAYGATNTPHTFVIDGAGVVRYAGAIDNSPDGEGATPSGGTLVNHVDAALADLAAGKPVTTPVTKAYGCGVKYAS
jgi:peroxiredoxin